MKLLIDVKKLMVKLQAFNPDIDLTGVKAYFFDLALSEGSEDVGTTSDTGIKHHAMSEVSTTYEAPSEPSLSQELPVAASTKFAALDAELPPGLLGDLAPTRKDAGSGINPTIKVSRGGRNPIKLDKDEKLAKREEARKFAEMNSKDLVNHITSRFEKKPGDGNQFVDDGADGNYSGGDLEIG